MEAINKFLPYLVKLGDNKILKSIRDGLSFTIPFTILGSVFLIIGNFPVEAWLKFITPYSSQLNSMVTVTFGVLGLISAFGVSYSLAINYGLEPLTNTVIAVLAFLLFSMNEELAIVPGNLGASGMFTAILAGILTTMVTRFVTKRNWTIKMPEGVPPAVAKSFSSLTPAAITLTIVWIIRVMLSIDITQILQSIFKPIVFSLNTIPGLIVYTLVALGLWTIGIHGPNLLSGIATPIFLTNIAVNVEAFQAGNPIPNEVAE
ncbi:PTS sugar transporter subunit IIC, partial [Listeria welshimeri]|nr:PTS sugar transporter subunit IIC [Listeria welshimeri]